MEYEYMKCEFCEKEHYGEYGSGRFCSPKCARSFSRHNDEHKTKIVNCFKCDMEIEVDKRASPDLCSCDECSGRNKIKNKISQDDIIEKICADCGEVKDVSNFYIRKRRNIERYHSYCKQCVSDRTLIRQQKLKKQAVEYKGGKCVKCGYDKYIGALDFHHNDPSKKEFNISRKKRFKFDDIKLELDKCDLICSNCHREIHAGIE